MNHALYLFFNGNCEEAINYYKDKLDGNIESIQRWGDVKMGSEAYKNKVMHSVLTVYGYKIMASDASEERNVTFGDNFAIALDFKHDGDMRSAFDALSTGGQVTMPLQDTFWGAVFGSLTDKFGVNWMFNHDTK